MLQSIRHPLSMAHRNLILLAIFLVSCAACAGPGYDDAAGTPQEPVARIEPRPATPESSSAPPAVASSASAPTPSAATPRPSVAAIRRSSTGVRAYNFKLTRLNGDPFELSELRGQVVVLNFWASWCPPCLKEMPAFERVYQEYHDRGVAFVGVAVSDFTRPAKAFAAKTGITYPLGLDYSGEIARAYRVISMPTTFFIDPQGNIVRKLENVANEALLRIFIDGQLRDLAQP